MKKMIAGAVLGAILISANVLPAFAANTERVNVPDGFINPETVITVDSGESDDLTLTSIRYKLNHSSYTEITDTKSLTLDDNGTLKVSFVYTDKDGKKVRSEVIKEIKNFDGDKPSISASIKGEVLSVKGNDDFSGIKLININGKDYTDLLNETLSVDLKELEMSEESLVVYAVDNAGNRSNTFKVNNPYYVSEDPISSTDRGVDNPQSTDSTKPTVAKASIIAHTNEYGDDLSDELSISYSTNDDSKNMVGSKQFFTLKTKTDKVFYIVVDETYNNETAYLLTEVGENDLLNFVNYDGNAVDNGEVSVYSIADNNKSEVISEAKPEESSKEAVDTKSKKNSGLSFIAMAVAAVIGVYFVKFKKKETNEDDDEYDEFESDTVLDVPLG